MQKILMELVLPGSQVIFDSHYADQTQLYLAGKFRTQRMNRDDIIANQTSSLIFLPE